MVSQLADGLARWSAQPFGADEDDASARSPATIAPMDRTALSVALAQREQRDDRRREQRQEQDQSRVEYA